VIAPTAVQELADQRAQARTDKDYARSDELRSAIAALGWAVKDTAAGQELAPLPPYPVLGSVGELPERPTEPGCCVTLLVEGWPDDLRTCVGALLEHTPDDIAIVLLENGPTEAGEAVHELADHPRVSELHVERPAGWAEARNALIRSQPAAVHVLMDPSTVLTGDALTPLVAALEEASAAGWRGVGVDDGWLSFSDSPGGEVEALLSYLIAVRREAALAVPLPPKARFYRNADMEWSFLLREAGHRLVAVDVPARQDRHRGYHDSDPAMRDRESKKTYDRFLQRFRGREELRLPRSEERPGG
jgi:hypothetical protein